jgi:hypothetical protein
MNGQQSRRRRPVQSGDVFIPGDLPTSPPRALRPRTRRPRALRVTRRGAAAAVIMVVITISVALTRACTGRTQELTPGLPRGIAVNASAPVLAALSVLPASGSRPDTSGPDVRTSTARPSGRPASGQRPDNPRPDASGPDVRTSTTASGVRTDSTSRTPGRTSTPTRTSGVRTDSTSRTGVRTSGARPDASRTLPGAT